MKSYEAAYEFGTVQLDREAKKVLSKVINLALKHCRKTPAGSFFMGRYVKGIRPNFIASDQILLQYLQELAEYLSKSLGLRMPVLSVYGDLHSCFSVTWHEDKSSFNESSASDICFFDSKQRLLKFYIKLPLSYLDLSVSSNSRKYFLRSTSNELSYFDVRCTHRTYVVVPEFMQNSVVLAASEFVNRVLSFFVKRIGGINWPKSSNLYFLLYEDCPVFREYERREIARSNAQNC